MDGDRLRPLVRKIEETSLQVFFVPVLAKHKCSPF
jgi:hypothetical protein